MWTIIGVFAACFIGMLTLMSTFFTRVIQTEVRSIHTAFGAEFRSIRTEMNVRFDGVDRRLDGLDQRVGSLEQRVGNLEDRVGGLERKVDGLDRDVQALTRREFGT